MKIQILMVVATVSFVCQIIFSIYYSINIVDQNSLYNHQEENLRTLSTNQQHLQIEAAQLKSLPNLLKSATFASPINSTINLSQ